MRGVYRRAIAGRKRTPHRSTILGRMFELGGAAMPGERNRILPDVRAYPVSERPRWYGHPYNRAGLYRLAEALGWAPRGLRLAVARRFGAIAPRFLPAERAAVRTTLR